MRRIQYIFRMVYREQNIKIDRNLPEGEYKREYARVWRKQNKEFVRDYNKSRYANSLERVRSFKRSYIEYMGSECVMCGLLFDGKNAAVFDFHHVDPSQKECNFGGNNRKLETVKTELDKCVLVCSNCHRLLHAGVIELDTHLEAI